MGDMSFLPDDYLEERMQRRTNVISLALFVVVMGSVMAAYFVTDQRRAEVIDLQTQVNRQFEEAAKRLEQLEQLQARKQQMIHKAQVTSQLLERVPRSLVLAELINNMPTSMSLLEFELDTKPAKAPTPQGIKTALDAAKKDKKAKDAAASEQVEVPRMQTSITVVGVAPTDVEVAQFMASLNQAPLFSSVNLGYSEEVKIEDAKLRKFRIDLSINDELNMQEYQPKLVKRELKHNPMGNELRFGADGKVSTPTLLEGLQSVLTGGKD